MTSQAEQLPLQVLMKTVNQLSAAAPHSHVMLLAHQEPSGKVLCACQVPKVMSPPPADDITAAALTPFPLVQSSSFLSASDWATAVCGYLGGSAGGSLLVAKGTGSSSDITEALRWAEELAWRSQRR